MKILYFMNVDWSWIQQRPHIIAQGLDRLYDVTVLYPQFITRPWRMQHKTPKTRKCIPVFQIPFEQKIAILEKIEEIIIRSKIKTIYEYDLLWFSSPVYAKYIPMDYNGVVVYDDMDDNIALQVDPIMIARMQKGQEKLFCRADIIFVTSQNLLSRLPQRAREKTYLVRNGCGADLREKICKPIIKKKVHIGYLGTISEWFDFQLIEKCIEKNHDIVFDLFGPNLVMIPQNEQIVSHGVIEHNEIVKQLGKMDCLIMPFVLNEIVLAVDPVKLYEYIGLGKCIISVRYPEVEYFDEFVYFYDDEKSFLELVWKLKSEGFPAKYDEIKQREFLEKNSWNQRIKEIEAKINVFKEKNKR